MVDSSAKTLRSILSNISKVKMCKMSVQFWSVQMNWLWNLRDIENVFINTLELKGHCGRKHVSLGSCGNGTKFLENVLLVHVVDQIVNH